jgi:hypothetical protein
MRAGFVAAALLVGLAESTAAASIRCGNRLVNVGDSALELRKRCGEPDDVQRFSDIRVLFDDAGRRYERLIEIEEWVYLLGTGSIPRLVRIENGRVRGVETAPFSTLPRDSEGAKDKCRRQLFALKTTTAAQVRLTCGRADQRDRWQDERVVRTRGGYEVRRLVTRERWLYDFGPNHLLRYFEFANGRLVRMSTGERGFEAD